MSKFILWFGFLLSFFMLFIGFTSAQGGKSAVSLLWIIIVLGSGYKLFFSKFSK